MKDKVYGLSLGIWKQILRISWRSIFVWATVSAFHHHFATALVLFAFTSVSFIYSSVVDICVVGMEL